VPTREDAGHPNHRVFETMIGGAIVAIKRPTVAELRLLHEQKRTTVSLWLSAGAVLIALGSFVYPLVSSEISHQALTVRYLNALVGATPLAPYTARGVAVENSHADRYAETVGLLWDGLVDSEFDGSAVANGRVSGGWGTYTVCFPQVDVFRAECSTYADFEFSEGNRLARFTIDGLPVEQTYRYAQYDSTVTIEDDNHQIRAYRAGQFVDSDKKSKTIVLWMDRAASSTAPSIDLLSVQAQDGQENDIDVEAVHFPPRLPKFGDAYAVVRVPDSARFLYVCWSGHSEDEKPCDWINNIR